MARSSRIAFALLLVLVAGCGRPTGDCRFISARSAAARDGHYAFTLVLDPARTYATTLAARLVASQLDEPLIHLDIRIDTPDGATQIERLSLPLTEEACLKRTAGGGTRMDCQWAWRDLRPDTLQAGHWHVTIMPNTPAAALAGIGLSYECIEWEKEN